MTAATKSRDTKAASIKALNAEVASNEAKRAELEDTMAQERKMRNDESAENAAVVTEAKSGKEAIEAAIEILDEFYKKAGSAALVQVSASASAAKQPEMPDAGFSGAYTGSASGGVMGMMDVIKSDFEREIAETEAAEKQANSDFFEFTGATKTSISTKTVTKTAYETELTEVNSAIAEDKTSMSDEQSLLDKAIQELIELQPACIDTGMSYQERVAKREQEIESLKQTLCVLDKEGPVQTEMDC